MKRGFPAAFQDLHLKLNPEYGFDTMFFGHHADA
jgi:hypothetical protein